MEELYVGLGSGIIPAANLVNKLREDNVHEKPSDEDVMKSIEEKLEKSEKQKEVKTGKGMIVKGESNFLVRFARCCTPVPGDEILGYTTKGRGVSIHRKDCANLLALIKSDPERVVEVSWGTDEPKSSYVAEVKIKCENLPGMLADVTNAINDAGLNIVAFNGNSQAGNKALMTIKVEIKTIEQLKELMKKIRKVKGVNEVYRMNS